MEFELAYFKVTVQLFTPNTMGIFHLVTEGLGKYKENYIITQNEFQLSKKVTQFQTITNST